MLEFSFDDLAHLLRDAPQDLVVSGTNAGQNLGTNTNTSGTVSAAIAATRQGVPAIATSAGIGPDSSTAYEVAASLVVQMIRAIYSDSGAAIGELASKTARNVTTATIKGTLIRDSLDLNRHHAFHDDSPHYH